MKMRSLLAKENPNDKTGWSKRHNQAVSLPNKVERPILYMLQGWELYATEHKNRYESLVGDDGVLGPEWQAIGKALRGLLNGELGRLDGGTLDSFILDTAKANGSEIES